VRARGLGRRKSQILFDFYEFCTEIGGPKSKNAFVRGQNSMTPSPIFHPRNVFSMGSSNCATTERLICAKLQNAVAPNPPKTKMGIDPKPGGRGFAEAPKK